MLLLTRNLVCALMSQKQQKYLSLVGRRSLINMIWMTTYGSSLYTVFSKDGFLCTSKMFLLLNFQQLTDLKAWEAASRNTSTKQQLCQSSSSYLDMRWLDGQTLWRILTKPMLRIPSNMLKQVSEIYTVTVFNIFEEEFIESLGYYVSSLNNDGQIDMHKVTKEGTGSSFTVSYDATDKRAWCSCCSRDLGSCVGI